MTHHPALQEPSVGAVSSPEAGELARAILTGGITLSAAVDQMASLLLRDPKVDVMVAALTSFIPEDPTGWIKLGERAHVREWTRPGDPTSILAPLGSGPESARTMPWISRFARSGIAVLPDSHLLPPEAAQDRRELDEMGVRSLVGTSFVYAGDMVGSLSVTSSTAGPWSPQLVEDTRLLTSAVTSRMTIEQSRRALAEAIEANHAAQDSYQQFFGAVGHELRTPVSSILGYTEVLIDVADQTPDDPTSVEVLRDGPAMVRQCERLLGIVDSLLGAGRTLADDEQRQDVRVVDAVADIVHWHRTPASTAGVTMTVDVDPEATVRAHASGVRQVLRSLVGNAIAHHHPEGGTIVISTARLLGESGQEMVRIIVRDDGPGLPPEDLEKAFDPFARYAGFSTQSSGLGLPMARTLAERDGGAVRGESAPGVGSSFWLELPVREAAG